MAILSSGVSGAMAGAHLWGIAATQLVIGYCLWMEADREERRAHTWEYIRHCWVSMDDDPAQRKLWCAQLDTALLRLSSDLPFSIKARIWLRKISSRSGRRLNSILKRDRTIVL
jgi:hypothetical protein